MTEIVKLVGNRDLRGPYRALLLKWQESSKPTKQLQAVNDPTSMLLLRIKCILPASVFILLIKEAVFQQQEKSANSSGTVVVWLSISLMTIVIYYLYKCSCLATELATLINALIQFDRMHPKVSKRITDRSTSEKLDLCMAYMALWSETLIPLGFVFILYYSYPQVLTGYWLVQYEVTSDVIMYFIKMSVLLFNYICWAIPLSVSTVIGAVIHALAVLSLLDNIAHFETIARDNALKTERSKLAQTQMWREIQVLTCLLNDAQKELILAVVSVIMFILSCGLISLVKNYSAGIAFVAAIFVVVEDCLLVIVANLGGMAAVFKRSAKVVELCRRNGIFTTSTKLRKWESKFYKSCHALKVMFGSSNFVDALMPLNSLQFAISLSVNILILTRKDS